MSKSKNIIEGRLTKIKTEIGNFDLAVPGTVRKIFLKCGKPTCACQKDKSARHGPYYLWDRKVGKKLTSKSIDPRDAVQIKKWIENRIYLEKQIREIINLSQAIAADAIETQKKKGGKTVTS